MFDSDVSLYLHFPELIPLDVWERRWGDSLEKEGGSVRKKKRKSATKVEESEAKEGEEDGTTQASKYEDSTEQPERAVSEASSPCKEKIRGPRLVKMVISSLSKLTGDKRQSNLESFTDLGAAMNSDRTRHESSLLSIQTEPVSLLRH